MATKLIEQDGDRRIIHTKNGVDTKTAAVYVRELRTYTPLPNGFNLELANHVYETISTHEELWDQDNWRRLVFDWRDDGEVSAALGLRGLSRRPQGSSCGTAMCYAGWAAELTGADWVTDAEAIDEGRGSMLHDVLVPRTMPGLTDADTYYSSTLRGAMALLLNPRGFDDKTHVIVPISRYAELQLGLAGGEWLGLFDGGNDLEIIRRAIDTYAEHGPARNSEVEKEFRDWRRAHLRAQGLDEDGSEITPDEDDEDYVDTTAGF